MEIRKSIFAIRAEFYLILMTVIWGGTFIFIKISLDSLDPFFFLTARFGIALLGSLLIWRKSLAQIPRDSYLVGLGLGGIVYLGFVLQTLGLQDTSATKSGFITSAYVVFTPIIESILYRKLPSLIRFFSVCLVIFGIFLISFGGSSLFHWNLETSFSIGDVYTLISAFFFAVYIVLIDYATRRKNEKGLLFGQISGNFFLALLYLTVKVFIFHETLLIQWTGMAIFGILYTGILATIVSVLIQTRFQKAVTPTRAGLIFSLEPVFASIFAFAIAGEVLQFMGWIGCIVVMCGILLSEIPWKQLLKKSSNLS